MKLAHLAVPLLLCAASLAHAAGDEIQVYGADINKPGERGLELHVNYVAQGSKQVEWPGQKPVDRMLRVTPEFSWGITERLELGMYVPMIKASGSGASVEGVKGRVKYLVASDDAPFYWGVNFELGRVALHTESSHWNAELRPILGYRSGNWEFIANPILGSALSDGASRVPEFEPAFKIAYELGENRSVGLEHYSALGPVNNFAPSAQREQSLFLVFDGKLGGTEVNFGVGRGWGASPDKWVVKAILGF
jgi:hypothetical protein